MIVLRQNTEAHNPFFLSHLRQTPSPLYNNADFRILNHRQIQPNFILAQTFFASLFSYLDYLFSLFSVVHPDTERLLLAKTVVSEERMTKESGKNEKWNPIKFIILSNQMFLFVVYVRGFLAVFETRRLSSSAFAFFSICLPWEKEPVSLSNAGILVAEASWIFISSGALPFCCSAEYCLVVLAFVCFMRLRNVHE
jgi:hypothetical protein